MELFARVRPCAELLLEPAITRNLICQCSPGTWPITLILVNVYQIGPWKSDHEDMLTFAGPLKQHRYADILHSGILLLVKTHPSICKP